jgi:Tat protein secretion system quality control protein TatD with DNase activity
LLLTETDNPGGLKWLKGELGMPRAIANVVETLAALRQSTPERIERLVHGNFARLIKDDPWLQDVRGLLLEPNIQKAD